MNINMKKCSIIISLATTIGLLSGKLAAQDSTWELSRTLDGHPDLQGVWANNSITPVERPDEFADREFLTAQDIEFLQRRVGEIATEDGDALFGDWVLSVAVSGETESYDPTTGNYDQVWLANRSVHNRTSQITDPPNGKYPPRTEQSIAAINTAVERRRDHPADSWLDRSLGERCLSFGAPYLGSGYNSYWQIVQAQEYVVIVQEMAHDARIIPLTDKPHLSDDIKLWHGDSRGYWDGDTLVIETSNYSDKSGYGPNASDKINVERLTRVSANELQYEITSHDPGMFTAAYTRQIIFDYSPDLIFEYACHEGNYGMTNILSGHRAQERMARETGNVN